jgi:hypothetical protein
LTYNLIFEIAEQRKAMSYSFIPFLGDLDADGIDSIGLYNPSTSWFYLRNRFSAGTAESEFGFGPSGAGWLPLAMGPWE